MKVLVNGNSFYYGRALLSYNPCLLDDQVTVNRAFFAQDLIAASNKPHILIDPCTSEGGEMTLPFIWPENYLDITKAGWEDNMGRCTIHDFHVLKHANGGTDPITVAIFVWAEDVSLLIPTTLSVQSSTCGPVMLDRFGFPLPFEHQSYSQGHKKKKTYKKMSNTTRADEFKHDGLISKPASAVAKIADYLSVVPIIGPYAKATSMIAGKMGQVAKLFGYSRPQIVADVQPYVPRYAGNLANTDVPENVNKLSLDSKNELTIDTRTMGLSGEDEMTIHSIASRMTFWKQFDWPEVATSGTMLASMKIMPMLVDYLSVAPVTEIHSTAMAFATLPFAFWQGSIKFHFKVICSEYHRGRLRLVYSPHTIGAGDVPFNQVYSTIVDISADKEFDYECKWTNIRAWGQVPSLTDLDNNFDLLSFSTETRVSGGTSYDNGTLAVYVVNELATPSTEPADIRIQIWVSAGDDFAVSCPVGHINTVSLFKQQATMEQADEMPISTADQNNPVGGNPIDTYGTEHAPLLDEDNQYLIYQGERVLSFRDLLRRYVLFTSYFPDTSTSQAYFSVNTSGFPYYRGYDPNGIDQGENAVGTGVNYNYCATTLLNYLAPAFVCMRGGLRHKWSFSRGNTNQNMMGNMWITRGDPTISRGTFTLTRELDTTGTYSQRRQIQQFGFTSINGSNVTPVARQNFSEIEIPYYSLGQRFRPARKIRIADFGLGDNQWVVVDIDQVHNNVNNRLDQYVSIAEDFTFGMFVGAPILYNYSDPPDPTAP